MPDLGFDGGAPRAWPLFILALHPRSGLGWLLVILRTTLPLLNVFSLYREGFVFLQMETKTQPEFFPLVPAQGTVQRNSGQEKHLLLVDWEDFGLHPVRQPCEGEGGQGKATSTPQDFKVFLDSGSGIEGAGQTSHTHLLQELVKRIV